MKKSGFTLIELLIVVAIIAILAAIAVPNFLEAQTRSKVTKTMSDMRATGIAMTAYYSDNNNYPMFSRPAPGNSYGDFLMVLGGPGSGNGNSYAGKLLTTP